MKTPISHLFRRAALGLVAALCCAACAAEAPTFFPPPPLPPSSSDPAPDELNFFAFGDWGNGSDSQKAVAQAVASYCANSACNLAWLLGDNFYDAGVASVEDPQWKEKFEDVYADRALQIPFYAVLGNHDHDGTPQAEIDYTGFQGRWNMPAANYVLSFPEGADEPLVDFFAVDSVYGKDLAPDILENLRLAIEASQARWRVLILHHPLFSNGDHGDTVALRDQLTPLICDRIDAVLSGHDHLLAHLDNPETGEDGCSFQQFVAGTGGRGLYEVHPHPGAVFSESSFGFLSVRVTPDEWALNFNRSDGSVAYGFSLHKP